MVRYRNHTKFSNKYTTTILCRKNNILKLAGPMTFLKSVEINLIMSIFLVPIVCNHINAHTGNTFL